MKVIREHTVYFTEDEVRRMAGFSEHWKLDDINRSERDGYEVKAKFIYEVPDEHDETPTGTVLD